MVILSIRKSNKNAFGVAISNTATVQAATSLLAQVNGLRIVLLRLAGFLEELATLGVQKPEQLWGSSFQDIEKDPTLLEGLSQNKKAFGRKPTSAPEGFRIVADKNNRRYGVTLTVERAEPIVSMAKKIKERFNSQTEDRLESVAGLQQLINELKLAAVMVYGGYEEWPAWEPAFLLMEEKIGPEMLEDEEYPYYSEEASLWLAGKVLPRGSLLSEFIKQDRSKARVKLQNPGAELPTREPPIDNETYRKIVQYYHRKNDEFKKLEENSLENQYYKGEWTEPKLKQSLVLGEQKVSYRPGQ